MATKFFQSNPDTDPVHCYVTEAEANELLIQYRTLGQDYENTTFDDLWIEVELEAMEDDEFDTKPFWGDTSDATKALMAAHYKAVKAGFTMKDQSSQPFAWTLEGVDIEGVAAMGAQAYVEAYVKQSIAGWAENPGGVDELIYEEWQSTLEPVSLRNFVENAIAQWQLEQVMTTSEAAEEFGVEQITVIKNIERGNLPARKSGGTWLIRRADAMKRWASQGAGRSISLTLISLALTGILYALV